MIRLRWTEQAVADLESIRAYIARDSESAAAHFLVRLMDTADRIPEFPEAGRIVPEKGDPGLRERIVGTYRLVYRLRRDVAEILTVHHGARLLRLPSDPA